MSIYDKPEGVYVIIKNRSGEIASVMGPMSGRKADHVENGAIMRVDVSAGWFVDVAEELSEAEQQFLKEDN